MNLAAMSSKELKRAYHELRTQYAAVKREMERRRKVQTPAPEATKK